MVPSPIRVASKVPRSMVVAGADLDVGPELHAPQLRHLDVLAVVQTVAETIGAEHGVGMNDDSIAQHSIVVQHGPRIDGDVVADPAESADDHMAVDPAAGPDGAAFADHGQRMNARLGAHLCGRMHDGTRIDTERRLLFGPALKVTHDGHKRHERIGRLNDALAVLGGHVQGHDGRVCLAALELECILVILDESDVARLCVAERTGRRRR